MIGVFDGIEVGAWYRIPGGNKFEVVALDLSSETIEIQYYDGAVEEIEFDSWLEMGAVPTAEPHNIAGALDMNPDDYAAYEFDSGSGGSEYSNPLDSIDQVGWH